MKINFLVDKGGITATLLVDDIVEKEDIPFSPKHLLDLRGCYLYYYCKEYDILWEELEFEEDLDVEMIKRGWDYMLSPIYVYQILTN